MEVLAASSIPLRPDGLALLMAHKKKKQDKEELKRAYLANVHYSILGSFHTLCESDLKIPTYSEFVQFLEDGQKPARQMTNQETWQAASDMLAAFL